MNKESTRLHRSPTEILLDEWGTSGRRRATVSDLLDLLVQVELYRAADYVATNILNAPPPTRPEKGPGARIDISLPSEPFDEGAMEELLNHAAYPNSSRLIDDTNSLINNNNRDFSYSASVNHVKFRIPITDKFNSSDELTTGQSESDSHSDLIMFSAKTTTSNNIANSDSERTETSQTVFTSEQLRDASHSDNNLIENLNHSSSSSTSGSQWSANANLPDLSAMGAMPNLSALGVFSSKQYDHSNDSSQVNSTSFIPDIENLQIRDQSGSNSVTNKDETTSSQSVYIPNLSILNGNGV